MKGTRKYESVIVLVLSQFRGSDYLGAWNRLPGEGDTRVTFLAGAIFTRGRVYRLLNHPRTTRGLIVSETVTGYIIRIQAEKMAEGVVFY